jgi:hypothetical protein
VVCLRQYWGIKTAAVEIPSLYHARQRLPYQLVEERYRQANLQSSTLLSPRWGNIMKGNDREEWIELCALAADEQDPAKLLILVTRINDLLEAKEARLERSPGTRDTA